MKRSGYAKMTIQTDRHPKHPHLHPPTNDDVESDWNKERRINFKETSEAGTSKQMTLLVESLVMICVSECTL
jgi:hypothetical protein